MAAGDNIVGVALSEIDPELRPASSMRAALDEEAIARYAETLDSMPAVRLAFDATAGVHWVVDGAHTITGARRAGRSDVRAVIVTVDRLEAFRLASHCNATHGVPIRNADKRHRVEVALGDPEMRTWSQGRIAEWCGVSQQFVSTHDTRPTHNHSELPKTTGRDGKARKPPSPRKPRTSAAAEPKPKATIQPVAPIASPLQSSVVNSAPTPNTTEAQSDDFDEDLAFEETWSQFKEHTTRIFGGLSPDRRWLFAARVGTLGMRLREELGLGDVMDIEVESTSA